MTIKEIRTQTGLSQVKFAEKFDIPRRTIEDWETDKRVPTKYVVELIEWRVNTDMEEKTYNRLKAYSDRMAIPMNTIITKAITEFLDKEEE